MPSYAYALQFQFSPAVVSEEDAFAIFVFVLLVTFTEPAKAVWFAPFLYHSYMMFIDEDWLSSAVMLHNRVDVVEGEAGVVLI